MESSLVKVGTPVTICHYSDADPAIITKVFNDRRIEITPVAYELTKPPVMVPGGFAGIVLEPAVWTVDLTKLEGRPSVWTKRKNGRWIQKGHGNGSNTLSIGKAIRYYDYGF